MCICINCRHLNKCKIYKFVQEQHKVIHKKRYNVLFQPSDTIISVNIIRYKKNTLLDWDLRECSSFTEKPNNWNK
uniref:Ycf34 n=1 Tax=Erythrocystis saccata TaxID=2822695 RepID=A0A8E6NXZ6_9FLOR|nr:hypothetical protein [Erythrocystis saccata]